MKDKILKEEIKRFNFSFDVYTAFDEGIITAVLVDDDGKSDDFYQIKCKIKNDSIKKDKIVVCVFRELAIQQCLCKYYGMEISDKYNAMKTKQNEFCEAKSSMNKRISNNIEHMKRMKIDIDLGKTEIKVGRNHGSI